jgi:hypothetical protein
VKCQHNPTWKSELTLHVPKPFRCFVIFCANLPLDDSHSHISEVNECNESTILPYFTT